MVFSGLTFLYLFLPVILILYYCCKDRVWRNGILVLFSLFFYAWGEPFWVILLLFTTLVDYALGLLMDTYRDDQKKRRLVVTATLLVDLGILFIFKYSGFMVESINAVLGIAIPVPKIALPIGISFYTFQALSYIIDVYREEVPVQRNYWNFLLYVSLFPQLAAGPIVRYSTIADEIENRKENFADISNGINRFTVGLFKKVIMANGCGKLATMYMGADPHTLSPIMAWFGLAVYAMQYYFDFSGYSDMAIGLGMMFGFHYDENFDYPFISQSVSEYWRRWHISLGSWFRDYLFYPLMMSDNFRKLGKWSKKKYGKKVGANIPTVVALVIVWFSTGLWHGASWNFVLWGLFFGLFLILEMLFLGDVIKKLPRVFRHAYLLIVVLLGFGIFYFTDLSQLAAYFGVLFGVGAGTGDFTFGITLQANSYFLVISVLLCTPIMPWIRKKLVQWDSRLDIPLEALRLPINVGTVLLCTAFLVGQSYNPFMYFRF